MSKARRSLDPHPSPLRKIFSRILFFLAGAIILCGFSIIQKIVIGGISQILILRGYIVPFIYGGTTGLILGEWYIRLREGAIKIEASEERLRTLIDALPDFVIFKDGAGRWMDINETARNLFILNDESFRGKTDLELAKAHPALNNLMQWCYRTDAEMWAHGTIFHCQVSPFELDNKTRSYDLMKIPVFWPDGDRKGMVIIGRDVTKIIEGEQQLLQTYDSTLEGWAKAVEMRDKETESHTRRVVMLTENLARILELPDTEMVHIRRGAMLHDIGKIGIPDAILIKPGPLTDEEMDIMRQHPQRAYDMLVSIDFLLPALDIPYCHHERWDGNGYPHKLKGEQIPMTARIFAVVDVWDALTSDRPYRKAWTQKAALEYIREQSGSYFDPAVVAAFLKHFEALTKLS